MPSTSARRKATAKKGSASWSRDRPAYRQPREPDLHLESIEQSLKEHGIQVQIFPDSGILRLPERILFDTNQAVLNPEGRNAVAALARALEPILPCFANVQLDDGLPPSCPWQRYGKLEAVFIEGHTDNVPVRGQGTNWELSAARAIGTYNALIAALPAIAEVRNDAAAKLIGVSGYGEFRPVFEGSNATEAGRRIDLRFLMATPEPTRAASMSLNEAIRRGH